MYAVDPGDVADARNLPPLYPGSAPRPGDPTTTVSVARADPGAARHRQGAVGLSLESSDLADHRLSVENADLVTILDALHGPTLRFGGNSTDRRMFFTARDEAVPTDWRLPEGQRITRVTPGDLTRVAALAERTNASVILSADLAHNDPDRAGELARAANDALGDRLVGLMIGNEPNGYQQGADNPLTVEGPGWDPRAYSRRLGAYTAAVHREVPRLPIVAPGAYSAPWWNAAADTPGADPMALAVHEYPLSECRSRWPHQRPTVANAAAAGTRARVDSFLGEAHAAARPPDAPLWITETSLSACAGSNEITETLAGAVYQADYALRAQQLGAQRVAVHSSLAPCHGGPPMSPLCSDGTPAEPGQRFGVRANGLALALIASIPDGTVSRARTGAEDLTGFAVAHPDGSTSLVLSDFRDPGGAGPRTTTVRLPRAAHRVTQAQLRARSWQGTYPVAALFERPDRAGQSASAGGGAESSYPGDPHVALSVEAGLRGVGDDAAGVDGHGLPIAPPQHRPAVAGVRAGAASFAVSLPAGSTTVLTIEAEHDTARPGTAADPTGRGTPARRQEPGVPVRTTTRSGGR
ncbi:hypothetical protein C1C97_001780 [Kocuria tytonis]|uniref:Beta-glucuronidase C-terminal domain-containing protein n=1 Tax=Kocuria tytonis TaxID=2054280 RepID=A0A495A8R3_9MICC|nr:hypothetical protein C1C97_001780 [Kocuria tytonis]